MTQFQERDMKSVLVVSRRPDAFNRIKDAFETSAVIRRAEHKDAALAMLTGRRCDILFIDVDALGPADGPRGDADALSPFRDLFPSLDIVVMSSKNDIRQAVDLVRSGAGNYLTHPIAPEEVKLITAGIREKAIIKSELDYLRDKFWKSDALAVVQTHSDAMKKVFEKVRSVAPTRTTVMLSGETGVGKGVLARLIHRHSNRESAQFISVHCGAIPETLLESELFGHERGAFTGAVKRKLGKFEIARSGTIFLDEIGTISPPAQVKLLQVLQDGMFARVGGEETLHTDARVIAAANADLKTMSQSGEFRKDLYYRLNVFPIDIPPLRERTEDIPHLARTFLAKLNADLMKDIREIHPAVIAAMTSYAWPGNIREMENLIERAYILETASLLTPESFPEELFKTEGSGGRAPVHADCSLAEARRKAMDDFERRFIKELIARNKGKINASAQSAGISARQLHKLMLKHGVRKEDYKS